MKRKHKRLTFVAIGGLLIAAAAALMLTAFEESIVFFRSPSDVAAGMVKGDERFRLGGLVADGSVVAGENGQVSFVVTDTAETVRVSYTGILPDLFREGQGVVTEGRLVGGVFMADEVLAKHDENYMPPEVAEAIKATGQWKGEGEAAQ
ncbi:MAG: cytochrome c maturation protein CcmE [Rhodospirillales bacterium]